MTPPGSPSWPLMLIMTFWFSIKLSVHWTRFSSRPRSRIRLTLVMSVCRKCDLFHPRRVCVRVSVSIAGINLWYGSRIVVVAARQGSVFSQRDPLYIGRPHPQFEIEGYPTDTGPDLKDGNFSDLVFNYRVISNDTVDGTCLRRSLRLAPCRNSLFRNFVSRAGKSVLMVEAKRDILCMGLLLRGTVGEWRGTTERFR